MTASEQALFAVNSWVNKLSALTRWRETQGDVAAAIAVYVGLLAREFPAEAFTDDSLQAVAGAEEWFPTYATLRAALHARQAAAAGLPSAPQVELLPGLDAVASFWVHALDRRLAEIEREGDPKARSPDAAVRAQSKRASFESLMRQQCPEAWAFVFKRNSSGPAKGAAA